MSLLGDLGTLAQSLLNPYGTPSQGEWNLQRGTFTVPGPPQKSVVFFIEQKKGQTTGQLTAIDQISESGGRRLAVYEYPYQDGQSVDDLGRKGEKFSYNIKFVGLNYQIKLKEFIDVCLNSNQTGTLTDPVRGSIKARFQDYEFIHRYDEWNAVTIRATFIEDNSGLLDATNKDAASPNSALRTALQAMTSISGGISQAISDVSAALLIPSAVKASLNARINSLTGQISRLLGQLAATFSTDAQTQTLFSNAQSAGGVTNLNSGTSSTGQMPPVYQVGFSAADQTNINAQQSAFVNSNQVTPQSAIFAANQARAGIASAIAEIESILGNDGFDIMLLYRQLAVQIQQVTQACLASEQSKIKVYRVPTPMSLRQVAFNNKLGPDAQNDIEALNPYLASVNFIPPGTMLVVPTE